MLKVYLIFASLFLASASAFSDEGEWIDCRTPDKKIIFQNGSLKMGHESFQNFTTMEDLFQVHSEFKKSKSSEFTIHFLPTSEKVAPSLGEKRNESMTLSQFKKTGFESKNANYDDGERGCRIDTKTTTFTVMAEFKGKITGGPVELSCTKTWENRYGGCDN